MQEHLDLIAQFPTFTAPRGGIHFDHPPSPPPLSSVESSTEGQADTATATGR